MKTIIVPCDGATNIKVNVYDYDTLLELNSSSTETPTAKIDGMIFNSTTEEFEWFDSAIARLPRELRNAAVISPVSRGASAGLIDSNNKILDSADGKHTLAYTQNYSTETDREFAELCGDEIKFFIETGSISTLPGSLTLIKRLLFEELERPQILRKAERLAIYPVLMSGHFLGSYLEAANLAGNEHSYWMCHSGARNINSDPGTKSNICDKIKSFSRLIPKQTHLPYKPIDTINPYKAQFLNLPNNTTVLPGGHDTCFSHIPIASSFYQNFPKMKGKPFIHLEIGTWTMGALIGAFSPLSKDMFGKGIIVQGTVDGFPVLTSMYAGGSDFKYLKEQIESHGMKFESNDSLKTLSEVLHNNKCFVQPNINPSNRGHGPFPGLKGRIINEGYFFSSGERAFALSNLMSSLVTSHHIELISTDRNIPIVLTGGGAKGKLFGDILSSLIDRDVYTIYSPTGEPLVETTSLGAAIIGKAGCLNIHPYDTDISSLRISYRKSHRLDSSLISLLNRYRRTYFDSIRN
ncbi:MAG TPA: hypothetical protein DD381_10025 [Lentisphaeria bacterium]|nr:MAG: hypothetical protein A2X47_09105 [Lentisphaerae bacterium GWF2_38_69]HBM16661.1 hypothetical protein [Lentisphaeria bacterium]